MPIDVYWDNEQKTILRADFIEDWTWDDYWQAIINSLDLIEAIEHEFVQILDMRQSHPIQAQTAISNIVSARRLPRKQASITVLVGAETIIRVIINTLVKAGSGDTTKRYLVNSLEEAYAIFETYFEEHQQGND